MESIPVGTLRFTIRTSMSFRSSMWMHARRTVTIALSTKNGRRVMVKEPSPPRTLGSGSRQISKRVDGRAREVCRGQSGSVFERDLTHPVHIARCTPLRHSSLTAAAVHHVCLPHQSPHNALSSPTAPTRAREAEPEETSQDPPRKEGMKRRPQSRNSMPIGQDNPRRQLQGKHSVCFKARSCRTHPGASFTPLQRVSTPPRGVTPNNARGVVSGRGRGMPGRRGVARAQQSAEQTLHGFQR